MEEIKQFFIDIRKGVFGFEELLEMSEQYIREFDYATVNTELPESIDRQKVQELLYELYAGY